MRRIWTAASLGADRVCWTGIFSFFPLWFLWICVKSHRCFFSPQKPTRTRRPRATPSNCCGLVVLWDKRLLSRHSGELHSLPAHIYRSPDCFSSPSLLRTRLLCVAQSLNSRLILNQSCNQEWKCVKVTARGG